LKTAINGIIKSEHEDPGNGTLTARFSGAKSIARMIDAYIKT